MIKKLRNKTKSSKGITLIALIITIVVLLILASITIGLISANNGVVKNATDGQILSALSEVSEALEVYKINNEGEKIKAGDYSGEINNEDLVSKAILKEVFVKDTYRKIGIIADLKEIGINQKLGKSGAKVDKNEIENIYELYDSYVIDFTDGTLYYIRDGIWSIDGIRSEYTLADGTKKECYEIESVSEEYVEKRKFITEWTISEAGTEIVLPLEGETNVEIEWGDGTTKEKISGTSPYPAHTYEQAGVYEVKIFGNVKYFLFKSNNYHSPSKNSILYITGIVQWGNIRSKNY